MTKAQQDALRWLADHNGDGARQRCGIVVAGGEVGPHNNKTWTALGNLGLIERYGEKGRRIRMTEAGRQAVAE